MSKFVEMWVVYDHPKDYPNNYVARKFLNQVATDEFMVCPRLETIESALSDKGLWCLRVGEDDTKIIQTWM